MTKKKLHSITLEPQIKLSVEYNIRADSKEEAEKIGMTDIVRKIADAFGTGIDGLKISVDD